MPATAENPVATRAASLAGEYDLIQVRTQPSGGVTTSQLHLAPLDSVGRASAVGGAVRDLVGWLEPANGDTTRIFSARSRDPHHPGVVLAGHHLRLGQPGPVDGYTEHLTITAVSPAGFWGWWKAERGLAINTDSATGRVLPDPAGYFCALRRAPGR